jgi:hypothetical protein
VAKRVTVLIGLLLLVACGKEKGAVAPSPVPHAFHPSPRTGCQQGIDAFGKTLHVMLRTYCAHCHDTAGPGPAHSVDDVQQSYAAIMGYVNWSDMDNSYLVTKGGNLHCLHEYGYDCKMTGTDIQAQLHAWWDQGQKSCPAGGKYVSKPAAVPSPLPSGSDFAPIEWDLNALVDGATLDAEIQQFADSRGQTYYLVRKPRLNTPKHTLHVENIAFLVNGKLDSFANEFSMVQATVPPLGDVVEGDPSPYPVLSSSVAMVMQDQAGKDELSVTFETLDAATAPVCKHLDMYRQSVVPAVAARGCYSCHGGGDEHLAGRPPANQMMNMDGDDAAVCATLLLRANGMIASDAPLISYPLRGTFGHPIVFISPDEILPDWSNWIAAEHSGQ